MDTKPRATDNKIVVPKKGISQALFVSDFYEIKHWAYNHSANRKLVEANNACFRKAFNDCFCMVIVNKGNFLLDLVNNSYDMHSGHMAIEKPNYEYRFRPSAGECFVLNFGDDFYLQLLEDLNLKNSFFFSNENIQLLMLKTSAEIEYIYFQILKRVFEAGKLEMDNLIMELIGRVVEMITNNTAIDENFESPNSSHLEIVEAAKEFLNENLASDISLYEISRYCCTSAFHFARIFKRLTSYSPHQYLLGIRLKHGEMMLKNSVMPISDISYSSGFSSVGYFATAFRQKYNMTPSAYRNGNCK
jgi:AraC family transcriptional regulator